MKKYLLYTLLLVMPIGLMAKTESLRKEFVKEVKHEFKMKKDGKFTVSNKHGEVNIKTWDKPEVKVDVRIIVQALDEQRAENIFNRIHIDMKNGEDFVKAITHIGKKSSTSKKWSAWNNSNGRDDFKINYEVYVPLEAMLYISNKYGDAHIAPTKGSMNADISYGEIRIEGVDNLLNLELSYGNAMVMNAASFKGEINYSDISVRSVGVAELDSKYSKIRVEKADSMRIVTKYDDFTLGDINTIRSNGKYGKFQISSVRNLITDGVYTDYLVGILSNKADVTLNYGGCIIENMEKDFDEMRLSGNYASFKVSTASDATYSIDASASYGDVNVPDTVEKIYERNNGFSYKIEGKMGNAPKGKIIANVNYGEIEIR